ncbi:MAG: hypothetical protein JXA57_00075 [Armatimonadetes bacterium]|nr:hypothetical protein [Armatimonadota bacterium]
MKRLAAWAMSWCGAAALALSVFVPHVSASETEPASGYGVPAAPEAKWDLQVGWYLPALSTEIRAETEVDGSPVGGEVDFEEDLDLDDTHRIFRVDAIYRLSERSTVDLTYYQFGRDASATLMEDVQWRDVVFPAGSGVASSVDTKLIIAHYGWVLTKSHRSEVVGKAGLHYFRTAAKLEGTGGSGLVERTSASVPLPTVGLEATRWLSEEWRLSGEFVGLSLDIGDYKGTWLDLGGTIEYFPTPDYAFGLGLSAFRLNIDADSDNLLGTLRYSHVGPRFFATAQF